MVKQQCNECQRVFNLLDDNDANEWMYGHDCEPAPLEDGTLGSCGCTDYHMADCPTLTGGSQYDNREDDWYEED